jgi:aerobic-type carbon monoxide dehydrogenase small subunit (CoxS/CutS family)
VRSCLVLAVEADGHEITTVEGLSYDGLSQLQNLFLSNNSFQCGFCAPGIVLAATELLEHTPNPSRHDVQEALAGNLCRCTGYEPIIEAVLAAGDGGAS